MRGRKTHIIHHHHQLAKAGLVLILSIMKMMRTRNATLRTPFFIQTLFLSHYSIFVRAGYSRRDSDRMATVPSWWIYKLVFCSVIGRLPGVFHQFHNHSPMIFQPAQFDVGEEMQNILSGISRLAVTDSTVLVSVWSKKNRTIDGLIFMTVIR